MQLTCLGIKKVPLCLLVHACGMVEDMVKLHAAEVPNSENATEGNRCVRIRVDYQIACSVIMWKAH